MGGVWVRLLGLVLMSICLATACLGSGVCLLNLGRQMLGDSVESWVLEMAKGAWDNLTSDDKEPSRTCDSRAALPRSTAAGPVTGDVPIRQADSLRLVDSPDSSAWYLDMADAMLPRLAQGIAEFGYLQLARTR